MRPITQPAARMSNTRIRTIKPFIWNSKDFVALSPIGRLTFLALITLADDAGRLCTDPDHLALTALHGVAASEIDEALCLMERLDMVERYRVDGREYLALIHWSDHQRIDRPTPSRCPAPPLASAREDSRASILPIPSVLSSPERGVRGGNHPISRNQQVAAAAIETAQRAARMEASQ